MDFGTGTHSDRNQVPVFKLKEQNYGLPKDPNHRERKGIDIGEPGRMKEPLNEPDYPRKYLKGSQNLENMRAQSHQSNFEALLAMKDGPTEGFQFPKFIPPGNIMNIRKKPDPSNRPKETHNDLSPEDAMKLLDVWRQTEYSGWDHWCKTARASFKLEIDPKPHGFDEVNTFSHHQTQNLGKYTLSFHRKTMRGESMQITGACIGKNHQDCRRDAIQKVFCRLQELGLLKYGLADRTNMEFRIPQKFKQTIAATSQGTRQVNSLNKAITNALNDHSFDIALEELRKTIPSKQDCWPEILQLWVFGLLQGNLRQLRQTIDIMQYLKIKNDEFNTAHFPLEERPSLKTRFDIYQSLKSIYGFEMVQSENQFDMVDPLGYSTTVKDFEVDSLTFDNASWLECDLTAQLKVDPSNYEKRLKPGIELAQHEKIFPHTGPSLMNPSQHNLALSSLTTFEVHSQPKSGILQQEKGIYYVDPLTLCRLYFTLIHSPNMKIAIEACENLYSRVEVDQSKLRGPFQHHTADYFASRLNMLALDMIESVFRTYCTPDWQSKQLITLEGKIVQVSYRNREQIFFFQPSESDWGSKVLFATASSEVHKDHKHWVKKNNRVATKDFVLLVCLERQSDNSVPKHDGYLQSGAESAQPVSLHRVGFNEGSFLQDRLNSNTYSVKELIRDPEFISVCCKSGTPKNVFMCMVDEITLKNTIVKLATFCSKDEVTLATKQQNDWVVVRVPVHGHHFRQAQALHNFVAVSGQEDTQGGQSLTNRPSGLVGETLGLQITPKWTGHKKSPANSECNPFIVSTVVSPSAKRLTRVPDSSFMPVVLAKTVCDSIFQFLTPAAAPLKFTEEKLKSLFMHQSE